MDAAREQHLAVGGAVGKLLEQDPQHRVPQHEARARADVAAALAPLEHEAARAVGEVQLQQPRRGHVQVGLDAVGFELACLIGAPTGDQRERRPMLAHDLELLGAQLGRHEAEQPDAPGALSEERRRLLEQGAGFAGAHQREREERQAAAVGDRRGELGAVADARHRTLDERVAGAVRLRDAGAFRERVALGERVAGARERRAQAHDDAGDGLEALCQRAGERGVLAERQHSCVVAGAGDVRADASAPLDARVGARQQLMLDVAQLLEAVHPRAAVRAERRAQLGAERHGLAAVGPGERRLQALRQRRLACQQQLRVEHSARGAGDIRRRDRVLADAAVYVDGDRERREQSLREHERALLADPAARLVPLGDHGVRARVLRRDGLSERGRDYIRLQARAVHELDQRLQLLRRRVREQHSLESVRLRGKHRDERLGAVQQHAAATAPQLA